MRKLLAFLLAALGAQAAVASTATPFDRRLGGSLENVVIGDEVTLAILAGAPDVNVIVLVNEIRDNATRYRFDYPSAIMAIPSFKDEDARTIVLKRKQVIEEAKKAAEARGEPFRVFLPLDRIDMNSFNKTDGYNAFLWRDHTDTAMRLRNPGVRGPNGYSIACTNPVMAQRDTSSGMYRGAQYCVQLRGVSPGINSPEGLWVSKRRMSDIWKQNGGFPDQNARLLYGVTVDLDPAQKPRAFKTYQLINGDARTGHVISMIEGFQVYDALTLNQQLGQPVPVEWRQDGMQKTYDDIYAAQKGDRDQKLAAYKAEASSKFHEFQNKATAFAEGQKSNDESLFNRMKARVSEQAETPKKPWWSF